MSAATPRKRTITVRRGAMDPADLALSPGDQIELSLTAEVKNRQGRSFWVKGGLSTTVREDETGSEAKERLTTFVIGFVDEQVREYLD